MAMFDLMERLVNELDLEVAVECHDEVAVQRTLETSKLIGTIKQLANCPKTRHEWLIRLAKARCKEIKTIERQQRNAQEQLPPIQRAISFPSFDNLASLRSGQDQFSRLSLSQLRLKATAPEIEQLSDDADKAFAYRWMLRGLSAVLAVRKMWIGKEMAKRQHEDDNDVLCDKNEIVRKRKRVGLQVVRSF